MLDEWTSRLLWLDPNDNELALRFHYDTLFINNIQTIKTILSSAHKSNGCKILIKSYFTGTILLCSGMLKLQFLCLRVPVAQWIERQLAELKVAGSNPARHATF